MCRAADIAVFSGDDADRHALLLDDGDVVGGDVAVFGMDHFFVARQVDPELEPEHPGGCLGHFLMQDAPARRHPLAAAVFNPPAVAKAVLVVDFAFHQICKRLNPAMRVQRKAAHVIRRIQRVERIQHEERVKVPDRP